MIKKLLSQDIHLLSMKWADPDRLPLDESIGPIEWESQYERHLEHTIAEWLAKGLVAYQYPNRRSEAFVPISHLVGTSQDSLSYLDSLVDIAEQLRDIRDPRYQPHPNTASREDDFVLLGECFEKAVAVAGEIVTTRLSEDDSQKEQCFQALVDSLNLMQAVRPPNAATVLSSIWSELQGRARHKFEEMTSKRPWVLEHALVLACYPDCGVLVIGAMVQRVIQGIEILISVHPETPYFRQRRHSFCG
jgi:hypothetical protein